MRREITVKKLIDELSIFNPDASINITVNGQNINDLGIFYIGENNIECTPNSCIEVKVNIDFTYVDPTEGSDSIGDANKK